MKKFMEKHWEKALLLVLVVMLVLLVYGVIDLITDKNEAEQIANSNLQVDEEQLIVDQQNETKEDASKNDEVVGEEEKSEQEERKDEQLPQNEIVSVTENEESEKEEVVDNNTKIEISEEETPEPKLDLEKDEDNDGAEDYIEDYFGTDKSKEDTDGDGLSDFIELYSLVLEPLNTDTDGNGVLDCDEDLDGDGLTNIEETAIGTNVIYIDTDGDSLSDYDETNVYNTNPLKEDTDEDGVSDAKEIEIGTDSSVYEETFYVVVESQEEDTVKVSVETTLSGEQVESLTVEKYENEFLFPSTMPGYIGGAYDFSVDGELGNATIKFKFDEALLTTDDFEPVIYYFDEENQVLEEIETTIEGNVASAEVTHFSKYILLDRFKFDIAFEWEDLKQDYSELELVFLVSDTRSMQLCDKTNERDNIVESILVQLPDDCQMGIRRYSYMITGAGGLTSEKDTIRYFYKKRQEEKSYDNRVLTYWAIENTMQYFNLTDKNVLKIIVLLGEAQATDAEKHIDVINAAKDSGVRIYIIEFGNSSILTEYMKELSYETGGVHYWASDILQTNNVFDDINQEINVEADRDNDGVPDYYEDNLLMFNGVKLKLDKNNPDTDGDGILDGEEVGELIYQYNEDNSQVLVTSKLKSNPLDEDTDIDGISDEEEVIIGTSQFNVDTDSDGLLDGIEYVEGFDPLESDADGDGRLDWREHLEGTDPYIYNKDWNEHVWEFICGVIAGDFITDSDSFATTAGQITGSFIPGIDVRDVIANLQHGDYLMAGLSSAGFIPGSGDVAKALGKAGEYAIKNADEAAKIGELSTFLSKNFPELAKAIGLSDEFVDVAKQLAKADNLKLTRAQRKILMETFEDAGLSQYLLKTSNLDGLKGTVDIGAEVWENGACKRGRIIDIFINKHDGIDGLGVNFPVADRVVDRTLVSTKSLDIAAQSYQNPSKLRNMLNKYANDLNNIETKYFNEQGELKWGNGTQLSIKHYDKKALEIVLPNTIITEDILTELNSFKKTMDEAGIEIWYRITK